MDGRSSSRSELVAVLAAAVLAWSACAGLAAQYAWDAHATDDGGTVRAADRTAAQDDRSDDRQFATTWATARLVVTRSDPRPAPRALAIAGAAGGRAAADRALARPEPNPGPGHRLYARLCTFRC